MLLPAEGRPYDLIVRKLRAIVIVLGLAGGAVVASAQPPASAPSSVPHPLSEYSGVTPGSPNPPPRVARLRARTRTARAQPAAIISWPGFQMQPGGGSRFFVETTGPVTTELHPSTGRIEIVFHDTAIHLENSRRWLETQYFETPVLRARLERRRRDMVLVMQLRTAAMPSLTTGPGSSGFTFTYIDFAAGHYLPDEPVMAAPPPVSRQDIAPGSGSVRPAAPSGQTAYPVEEDDERPPPVQMH